MALELSRSTAFLFKITDTAPKTLQNFGIFYFKSLDKMSTMQRNPMLEAVSCWRRQQQHPRLPAARLQCKKMRLCFQYQQIVVSKRAHFAT